MQAKVSGMAINSQGIKTVTLKFRLLNPDGKLRDPDSLYNESITVREDELSMGGLSLGDVLNVEFTSARTPSQADIDKAIGDFQHAQDTIKSAVKSYVPTGKELLDHD